jgi:hypothetical protein
VRNLVKRGVLEVLMQRGQFLIPEESVRAFEGGGVGEVVEERKLDQRGGKRPGGRHVGVG